MKRRGKRKGTEKADELTRAKESALMLLRYRRRSTAEMERRLGEKRFSEEIITQTISDLSRAGLLDDVEFAVSFTRSKFEGSGWGPQRLRSELFTKGIAKEIAEKAIEDVCGDKDMVDLVRNMIRRKLKGRTYTDRKELKRLTNYARRRGHSWEIINEALSEFRIGEDQ